MIVGFFPNNYAKMGVAPGVVAIDLCCGDGLFTVPLPHVAKRVYAIDIDPLMLDRALYVSTLRILCTG
jgi:ubiquinone/menaquinone biosynthesis C-methylase UbiE